MPGIIDFIKSLNTRVEKNQILDDIDLTSKELKEYVIPKLHAVAETAKITSLSSPFYNKAEREFYESIKIQRKAAIWITDLESMMANVLTNLTLLRKVAEDNMEQDTLRDAITARGAHIIRAASAMSFLSRYALELADYVVQLEIGEKTKEDVPSPPAQRQYMEAKLGEFMRLLADYSIPAKDFSKIFGDLPSIYIDRDNSGAMSSMFSRVQIDPFKNSMSMSGFVGNPIYHLRLLWTEWEGKRYHAAKDRAVVLELRLIHLRNLQANQPNGRVEKEIEGVQKRLNELDRWIRDVEQSVDR